VRVGLHSPGARPHVRFARLDGALGPRANLRASLSQLTPSVTGLLGRSLGAVALPGSASAVGLDLDQLAADAGVLELGQHVAGQVRRQLDDGEVRTDLDVAEIVPAEAALVGERPDYLARLDALPLAHLYPVCGHGLRRALTTLGT